MSIPSFPFSVCLASVVIMTSQPDVMNAASTGLVAAYAFNEGSGSTTADASGNGNAGTITGATWTTSGRFGAALVFNGTNSWVTVNDSTSLNLATAFTLEAWVNPPSQSSWQVAVIKEAPGGMSYAVYANTSGNDPAAALHTTVDVNLYGPSALPLNTWSHIAATYDGSSVKLYVNGSLVNSQSWSGQMPVSSSPLRIGGDSVWGEYFKGTIDEVRVYNRALSAAEIQTDMTTPISTATQTGLTVAPTSFTLASAGATQQLTVTGTFSDGTTQNQTSDPATTYVSSNTGVATVNSTGLVTAVANGSATITATHGSFSVPSTATVNIPPPVLSSVTVAPASFTLASPGATQQLTVTANYSNGSTQNVTSSATYSSNKTSVATVSGTGLVTGVATGTATITASYGGLSGTATATVPPALTGITVAPASFTLITRGATQQLSVTASYSDGTTQNVTSTSSYASSNTAVATVSTAGLVTAAGNGTATITATYKGASSSATATVNIPAATVTGITIAPTSFTLTSIGAKQQLSVTAKYSDNSTQDVTSSSTYTSSNTSVATVSTAGTVTAVATGSATITASYSGFSASSTATVTTTVTGLVAAYAFNEGSGTTVADASGNGNTGTISGATWTTSGRFGTALSFNGGNSWVTVNDSTSLEMSTAVTLEAWVRPTAPVGWQAAVIKEQTSDLTYALYVNTDQDQPVGTVNIAGTDIAVNDASEDGQVPMYTWTHLATTFDGTTLRLYENGVLVNSIGKSGKMKTGAGPLRIGGDSIWGEYFSGAIDEVRIYNRALSATEIQTDMNSPITPPALTSISVSPASFSMPVVGATQQITIAGTYSTGVTQNVTMNAGATFTSSNPSVATVASTGLVKAVANGTTSITATYGGFSQTITATVSVTSDPSIVGQWSQPLNVGVVAVNLILLRTGKVLLYGGQLTSGQSATVFDPATGNTVSVPTATDLFCSGHATLPDGRVLVVGGHDSVNNIVGVADANIFDPATQQWTSVPKMAYARWYPTAAVLPDGRVLVTSGAQSCYGYRCLASTPEIYTPSTNSWSSLTAATTSFWYYPFTFVLPDGRVLLAGTSEQPTPTQALSVASLQWSMIDPVAVDGGSATMYAPGKIMKSGTASDAGAPNVPASNTTYVLDMSQTAPSWQQTAPMASPRAFHNLTVLPDGTVLATGGEQTLDGSTIANAVYQAELWSPVSKTWSTLSLGSVPRLYHSTAVLMPDARVLVAGSGSVYPAADQTQVEYFSPPYLFKGTRPAISSAPTSVTYGSSFVIQSPDSATTSSIAMIRPSTVTHQFNQDQHFVSLAFQNSGGQLSVQAPANANVAPPGFYMVFLVNANGVPSVAKFIKIN